LTSVTTTEFVVWPRNTGHVGQSEAIQTIQPKLD